MSMGIIETLQAEIQALKERVTALEHKVYGAKIYRTTPEQRAAARERLKAQRQKTRDDIIEMAKRDIEALKTTHYPTREKYYIARNLSYNPECDAEFIINRNKRTVVCLLRKRYEKTRIISRGIAKCHPDDCFNAHIGRAIALRRALGLEVPEAYLNAPQPTEVRVGDIVEITCDDGSKETFEVGEVDYDVLDSEQPWVSDKDQPWSGCNFDFKTDRVIDDSRDEV
jgi:hypothetical protein